MYGLSLVWQERSLLLDGIWQTLHIATLSLLFSLLAGLVLGFLRYIKNPIIDLMARFHLESFRIIPLMVWLFATFFTLPTFFGFRISGHNAAILVFSLWGAAEMGEMVRGALISLPKIQKESGTALGLSGIQLFVYILLPQALRRLLPGIINMSSRLIKTSSMASLVGVIDVIRRGVQIIERTAQPLAIYTFIFFLFFFLCWPLSLFSQHLEKKMAKGGG